MSDICLVTLNSTYQHTAFGLRYLYANLKELQPKAKILEFTIHRPAQEIVDSLLALNPKIIGFGIYIWNTNQSLKVVELLKQQRPDVCLVLGGPEVSYETEKQKITQLADYVICGEADFLFYEFCHQVLVLNERPKQRIIRGPLPEISQIQSPYNHFTDQDIEKRIVYVEASRGCPYKCEYCLSSLDKSVRNFPLEKFLSDLQILIDRGARQFKFIDRTFNLSPSISGRILGFFLEKIASGLDLHLHFEMVPDRLPDELKLLIKKFPLGSLQFEIGVQTWNPQVAALVSRRQDYQKVQENLKFLKQETGVHTHVDLIAGLPGETLESFAKGFDSLSSLDPGEIQVGILKRLKGTPIIRHDQEWQMRYSAEPPFQILETKTMTVMELEKMQKFSKFWDLIANSGNFVLTFQKIREENSQSSLFEWFWNLTDFLQTRHPLGHSIHLLDLVRSLLIYFEEICKWQVKEILATDYQNGRPGPLPVFLRSETNKLLTHPTENLAPAHLPKRQKLHFQFSRLKKELGEGRVQHEHERAQEKELKPLHEIEIERQ
ncbi:MAG: DUF4080 domain-containing protein [Pseudobdellovibrionaceae bacterium]